MIYLFIGLIEHFIGDYLFQTHWMATEKTKKNFPAFIHAYVYSILFMFLVDFEFWLIIFITHFFIDRYRLAVYWIKIINRTESIENFGYPLEVPKFLSMILLFIVDNTFHIIINSICIFYSNNM